MEIQQDSKAIFYYIEIYKKQFIGKDKKQILKNKYSFIKRKIEI